MRHALRMSLLELLLFYALALEGQKYYYCNRYSSSLVLLFFHSLWFKLAMRDRQTARGGREGTEVSLMSMAWGWNTDEE